MAKRESSRDARATKWDVELAKVEKSHEVRLLLAYAVVGAAWLIAAAVPVLALKGVIDPLAGKTTKVDANIYIGVSIGISVAINGLQRLKVQSQRKRLEEQRDRIARLEERARAREAQGQ